MRRMRAGLSELLMISTEANADSDRPTGVLVEYGRTDRIFSFPGDSRTEQYVTGRFG